MENKEKFKALRFALLAGGVITLVIGVAHIFMPTVGYAQTIPEEMSKEVSDHFYYLGTYAICAFLLTLGSLSVYFSKLENTKNSLVLSFILALLWIVRTLLEIIYPVNLSLFILESPHVPLLTVMVFLSTIYSIGFISGYRFYLKVGQ